MSDEISEQQHSQQPSQEQPNLMDAQFNVQTGGRNLPQTPEEQLYYLLQQRNVSPRAFELLNEITQRSRQNRSSTIFQSLDQVREVLQGLDNRVNYVAGQTEQLARQQQQQQQQQQTQPMGFPPPPPPTGTTNNRSPMLELMKKSIPSKFDGTPSKLNTWKFAVAQFLDFCNMYNPNERAKFAVTLLEGRALTWWRGWSQTTAGDPNMVDLEDLFAELTSQFNDIDREMKLRRKLQSLRQTTSVQAYVSEFRRVQLELGSFALDDGAALFQFLQGLKNQVRTQVLLARPDTFEDAVLVAERSDAAIMFAHGMSGAPSQGGGGGRDKGKGRYHSGSYHGRRGHTPMDLDMIGSGDRARGGGEASGSGSRPGRPRGDKIVCYHCGKTGHIKRNCFKLHGKPKGRGGEVRVAEASGEEPGNNPPN